MVYYRVLYVQQYYLQLLLQYIISHFSINRCRKFNLCDDGGTFVGSMIPLLMNKLNIDPAVASGPFITTINDIISMLIYFGLATSFMAYLI